MKNTGVTDFGEEGRELVDNFGDGPKRGHRTSGIATRGGPLDLFPRKMVRAN